MQRISMLVLTLSLAGSASTWAQAPDKPIKVKEDKPGLLKRAKISPDSAIKLAAAAVPSGRITAGEIEEEKGKLIYSFDIKVPGKRGIEEKKP